MAAIAVQVLHGVVQFPQRLIHALTHYACLVLAAIAGQAEPTVVAMVRTVDVADVALVAGVPIATVVSATAAVALSDGTAATHTC